MTYLNGRREAKRGTRNSRFMVSEKGKVACCTSELTATGTVAPRRNKQKKKRVALWNKIATGKQRGMVPVLGGMPY